VWLCAAARGNDRSSEGKRVTRLGRYTMSAALLPALALAALVVAGCGGSSVDTTLVTPATVIVTVGATTTAPAETTTTTAPAATTTTVPAVIITTTSSVSLQEPLTLSDAAIAYAAELGGTSQKGQQLYLVVGAGYQTEQDAQAALDDATPLFGDMQAYYIIQLSDNFDGIEPGWFVLIEAYWEESNANEALDFGRRAFPNATVMPVIALSSDPIPVYEELEGS
jgi:hypothetical protein